MVAIRQHDGPMLWFETTPGIFNMTPPPCPNCGAQSLTAYWIDDKWEDRRWLKCDYCGQCVPGKIASFGMLLREDDPITIRSDGAMLSAFTK